jgi:hypothetical protein
MSTKPIMAEAKPPKKGPKVVSHLEIHPQLGGGHVVKHVYSGYQHDPREVKFGPKEGARAAAHVARYAGLPGGGGGEEPAEEEEAE